VVSRVVESCVEGDALRTRCQNFSVQGCDVSGSGVFWGVIALEMSIEVLLKDP
jgi:hypothetical protein